MATSFQYSFDLTAKVNRKILIDQAVAGTTYIGISQRPEVANADPKWMIVRETVVGALTTVEWAGGGGFDNVWSNRAALTYSAADASQP